MELKEKQEVLRQNAEEMQATQEELKRSNQLLEEQVEEVNRTQKRMQLLLENAIKHNQFDEASPLPVEVRLEHDAVVVANPLRPKIHSLPSTGIGLHNLRERVQLVSGATLQTGAVDGHFRVRLPVVRLSHAQHT